MCIHKIKYYKISFSVLFSFFPNLFPMLEVIIERLTHQLFLNLKNNILKIYLQAI